MYNSVQTGGFGVKHRQGKNWKESDSSDDGFKIKSAGVKRQLKSFDNGS